MILSDIETFEPNIKEFAINIYTTYRFCKLDRSTEQLKNLRNFKYSNQFKNHKII
jgi:hypothetical protein